MGRISQILKQRLGEDFEDHILKPDTEEQKKAMEEYAKKLQAKKDEPPIYFAENIYAQTKNLIEEQLKRQGKVYVEDAAYLQLHKYLSCYFAGDKKFETWKHIDKPNLNKGLYIWGTIGFGKTSLLKAFRTLSLRGQSFGYRSTYEVREMLENREKKIADVQALYHSPILFDELGKEAKSFGAELMTDVLSRRYDTFVDKGIKTHITSNLSPKQIGDRYGKHLESRIYEMCNVIYVKGNDKRKL
jgi:DNA replication protein DnaC